MPNQNNKQEIEDNKTVIPIRQPFQPPASRQMTISDPSKQKIASKVIDAEGVKLKELNLIPRGLYTTLVKLDIYTYVQKNPDADGEEISDYILECFLHYLRGVQGGLLNKVVQLAGEEYKAAQASGDGNIPGMVT